MDIDETVTIPLDASLDEVREISREFTSEDVDNMSAVYVLECSPMHYNKDELQRRASRWLDSSVEVWMRKANDATDLYYVGETGNVVERIVDHVWRQGAKCTQLFPPQSVVHIQCYSDREEARNDEQVMADLVAGEVRMDDSKDFSNTFIYQY